MRSLRWNSLASESFRDTLKCSISLSLRSDGLIVGCVSLPVRAGIPPTSTGRQAHWLAWQHLERFRLQRDWSVTLHYATMCYIHGLVSLYMQMVTETEGKTPRSRQMWCIRRLHCYHRFLFGWCQQHSFRSHWAIFWLDCWGFTLWFIISESPAVLCLPRTFSLHPSCHFREPAKTAVRGFSRCHPMSSTVT